jgi:hypothetical protein
MTRRELVQGAAVGGAAMAVGSAKSYAQILGANDRLNTCRL